MFIESIELDNYRNYESLQLQLDNGTTIIYGDNAQGKTNILEAAYVCSTTKSHKGSKDKELIRFNKEEAHIKLCVRKSTVSYRIDMHIKKSHPKGIAINGIPIKKASELFGIVNVIFFSPEDLYIIKNGPTERRRFLDLELCQLDKIYVHDIVSYNKIIMQRNRLLKELSYHKDETLISTLDIWDIQLAQYGNSIIKRREKFVSQINEIIIDIHKKITGNKEELKVMYEPSISGDNLYNQLIVNRDRDIQHKNTSVGPHRDDISFYIGDMDIRKYGSQGQQRTVALSLKLSEIELVKKIIKDTPILLLDDVLSELDSSRQNQLLNYLSDIQSIITGTGVDEFVENRLNINRIYKVIEGKIFNYQEHVESLKGVINE